MARAARQADVGDREREQRSTGQEEDGAQDSESEVVAPLDEIADQEEAEAAESNSDEEEQDDDEDIFHDARDERKVGDARYYCAFADANGGTDARLFAMLTGEAPEQEVDPVTMAQAE